MAKVSRPPILRIGHDLAHIGLEGLKVEGLESLGIAEVLAVGVGDGGMLAKDVGLERLGPPLLVGDAVAGNVGHSVRDGTLALFGHDSSCCMERCSGVLFVQSPSRDRQGQDTRGRENKPRHGRFAGVEFGLLLIPGGVMRDGGWISKRRTLSGVAKIDRDLTDHARNLVKKQLHVLIGKLCRICQGFC